MVVRPMTARDADAAARLSDQLGYPATADAMERRFRALADDPDAALLAAEEAGGRMVGWIHVCGRRFLVSDAFAEIVGLVVETSARRRGAGKGLVLAAEEWARRRGYSVMRIRSNVRRMEARPFYEKLGYEVVKSQWVFRRSL
ncbi:MAG TPA: GNAT family N-acetyltransferase [Candidatus Polarisedimenticolia bacterium]|nr:GNAT family N-acetyltransferase [Candidatus Polarisedimenticolia bacterium]